MFYSNALQYSWELEKEKSVGVAARAISAVGYNFPQSAADSLCSGPPIHGYKDKVSWIQKID